MPHSNNESKEPKNHMNTKAAKFITRLALGCAALGFCEASANAGEFSANAGTTFLLVPLLSTSPLQFTHTVDGLVEVSSLGDCTVHFDLIVTATDSVGRPYLVTGRPRSSLRCQSREPILC